MLCMSLDISFFRNYFWLGTISDIHFWLKRVVIIVVGKFGERQMNKETADTHASALN